MYRTYMNRRSPSVQTNRAQLGNRITNSSCVHSFELSLVFDRFGKSRQIYLAFKLFEERVSSTQVTRLLGRYVGYKITMLSWPERKEL